jgi:hypothetical protein
VRFDPYRVQAKLFKSRRQTLKILSERLQKLIGRRLLGDLIVCRWVQSLPENPKNRRSHHRQEIT